MRFRISSRQDQQDVLQEVCISAFRNFANLKNENSFKAWLLQIARNQCTDYFRARAKALEIPLDSLNESALIAGRRGIGVSETVTDALEALGGKDRQILYLYYFKNYAQSEIAARLRIPEGTVKSRLHAAKARFRRAYPENYEMRKEKMKTILPETMPLYNIKRLDKEPFACKWEELMGWMIVPKEGEKLSWGLYDGASGRRTEYTDMQAVGKCEIHGIEGVEIIAVQHDAEDYYRTGSINEIERRFVAQLTDTHTRYLAESHMENGVRKLFTFLDGESFLNNWGYGEENCGNETDLRRKGLLHRKGNEVTGIAQRDCTDVVGRYEVEIGGKTYDTVCVMDIECFNDAVASEQFIDENGRTVLWRRFNRNDWAFHRYGKKWTEMLPQNERLLINGETYVHWYDCLSDYVLKLS